MVSVVPWWALTYPEKGILAISWGKDWPINFTRKLTSRKQKEHRSFGKYWRQKGTSLKFFLVKILQHSNGKYFIIIPLWSKLFETRPCNLNRICFRVPGYHCHTNARTHGMVGEGKWWAKQYITSMCWECNTVLMFRRKTAGKGTLHTRYTMVVLREVGVDSNTHHIVWWHPYATTWI